MYRIFGVGVVFCVVCFGGIVGAKAVSIQWPVSAGGNDHWYEAVLVPTGITWDDAKTVAESQGGYLATIQDSAENDFVFSLIDTSEYWTGLSINNDILGPWLGGYSNTPGTWNWVTGEPFNYAPWGPNQPDTLGGLLQALTYYAGANIGSTWGSGTSTGTAGFSLPQGYVVESTVPEPSSLVLFIIAALGLLGYAWRLRRV